MVTGDIELVQYLSFNIARDHFGDRVTTQVHFKFLCSYLSMSLQNTVQHSNGELLTGRLWRKSLPYFDNLPFYSNIPRMDEIPGPLQKALDQGSQEGYSALLVVR